MNHGIILTDFLNASCRDLEQLLNLSQHSVNRCYIPTGLFEHFVARISQVQPHQPSNRPVENPFSCSTCHGILGKIQWSTTDHLGSDSPRRLQGPWAPRPVASPASWRSWHGGLASKATNFTGDHLEQVIFWSKPPGVPAFSHSKLSKLKDMWIYLATTSTSF